ncbi:MAG: hypothetical protein WBF33_11475 [Candidatus Nitrosopolaris sp.]
MTKEGDVFTLRLGAIPRSKGSLCAINEIDKMGMEDQKHFLDTMEEGRFTVNKFGQTYPIDASTSIIASANPVGNTWRDKNIISKSEFPITEQIRQRFDIVSIFREDIDTDRKREYITEKQRIEKNRKAGVHDSYPDFIRKWLQRSRMCTPIINDTITNMIGEYWIKLNGVGGTRRGEQTLIRYVTAIARLKLKVEADTEDAIEAMEYFNEALKHEQQQVEISKEPIIVAYDVCMDILRQNPNVDIDFYKLVYQACEENKQVENYLGSEGGMRINTNKRLRRLSEMFKQDISNIKIVNNKPITIRLVSGAITVSA